MKKSLLVILILLINVSAAQAYGFRSKMTAKVIEMSEPFYDQDLISGKMVLEIIEVLGNANDSYPIGTKVHLQMYSSHGAEYYENPKLYTSITKIVAPDGSTFQHDYEKFEIKPISGIKSSWIPFYRIFGIFKSKRQRSIGAGSLLTIKPTTGDDVIAVLKSNLNLQPF